MTIHIIKLCVGAESVADLAQWHKQRQRHRQELMHITRNMPKRADEVLDGGSLYWVIKSFVCARQKILELRPLVIDGVNHCGLVLDSELVRTELHPRRAFQGWRYLEAKEAPRDLITRKGSDEVPEEMARELAELGLL